jgi:hypothetical protein
MVFGHTVVHYHGLRLGPRVGKVVYGVEQLAAVIESKLHWVSADLLTADCSTDY